MPKVKIGKLATVLFLTVLIWIWADLALVEELSLSKVPVVLGTSADPALWVNFVNPDGTLSNSLLLDAVVLKGPTSKVRMLRQQRDDGSLDQRIVLSPQDWGTPQSGDRAIALMDFLEQSPKIRGWGLTVESCSPETFTVRIDRLVLKPLKIRCVDSNDMTIDGVVMEPDKVDMYIPSELGIEKQVAIVELTPEEVALVKTGPIKKRPSIGLALGQRQEADQDVTIHTPPGQDRLKTYTLIGVRAGILISETLQAKYQVKVQNVTDLYSHIEIRATEQAKQAYEAMRYQVILEIDAESTGVQEKALTYNFPPAYLRTNEIDATRQPATIRFTLVPLPAPQPGTPSVP